MAGIMLDRTASMEYRTARFSYGLGLLVILLVLLYPALNIAREPLHSLHSRWDDLIPFVPRSSPFPTSPSMSIYW